MAGFRATPDRRIPVLYGMVVYAIRFNNQLLHRQPTLKNDGLGRIGVSVRVSRAKENGEEFGIIPANGSETTELPVVLRKTLAAYPWIEPAYLLADRGYDSQANHRFLAEQGITPVIHIRKPTAADGLRDGIYTARASPPRRSDSQLFGHS